MAKSIVLPLGYSNERNVQVNKQCIYTYMMGMKATASIKWTEYNTIQYKTTQHNTIQCNAMQCNICICPKEKLFPAEELTRRRLAKQYVCSQMIE